MSEQNNFFEELEREQEQKFVPFQQGVKSQVENRKDIWSFIGEIVELYIPKIIGVLLGGTDLDQQTKEHSKDTHGKP